MFFMRVFHAILYKRPDRRCFSRTLPLFLKKGHSDPFPKREILLAYYTIFSLLVNWTLKLKGPRL